MPFDARPSESAAVSVRSLVKRTWTHSLILMYESSSRSEIVEAAASDEHDEYRHTRCRWYVACPRRTSRVRKWTLARSHQSQAVVVVKIRNLRISTWWDSSLDEPGYSASCLTKTSATRIKNTWRRACVRACVSEWVSVRRRSHRDR